jgi:DNA sulfur modification protein DndB
LYSSVPIDQTELTAVEAAAKDWFAAVAHAIGPALEDRANKLASAPAVLAAIGAIGSPLVKILDGAVRKVEAEKLASQLKAVDWSRSKSWAGIAGKLTPKGALSIGGAKETAYAVYSALADDTQPSYKVVRPLQPQLVAA